jgi:hypothetical protein
MRLEAFKHLFFNVFDVSELAPTSHIRVFRYSFNLHDKFFSNSSRSRYFSRRYCLEMSAVCFCRFFVPNPIFVPRIVTGTVFRRRLRILGDRKKRIPGTFRIPYSTLPFPSPLFTVLATGHELHRLKAVFLGLMPASLPLALSLFPSAL